MKEIREILVAPHVTEETMKNMVNRRTDVHKYVFKVALCSEYMPLNKKEGFAI